MKRTRIWLSLLALLALCASPAQAAILFNEIYANPVGTDDTFEFIELKSTTGGIESLSGLVLLLFDANGGGSGGIDDAYDLSALSTGTNGLLVLGNNFSTPPLAGPWNPIYVNPAQGNSQATLHDPAAGGPYSAMGNTDLSNNAFVALLVSGFSSSAGTDLDTNDDGVFDSTPWTSIVDSIAWNEGSVGGPLGRTYGAPTLPTAGYTPDAVARINGNNTPNSAAAWYGGDLLTSTTYDPIQNFNLPLGAMPTPTYGNFPVPEPSTMALGAIGALALLVIRRKR